MRKDMAKVLVERPRRGHEKSYRPLRRGRKHDLSEEAPKIESIRKPHLRYYRGKELNENLRPLERYLRSQVGRPWNKVYSEINQHVRVTNAVQAHIRQHIPDYIITKVSRDKYGQVWDISRLCPTLLHPGDLYVDTDGIIKILKHQPKFKVDKGMKLYAIYRARKPTRAKWDFFLDKWYHEIEYRLVEHSKMEVEGVTPGRVYYYFRCGTRTEALKELERVKQEASRYHRDREYVEKAA